MRRFAAIALGILIPLLTSFTLAQQTPTTSVPTLIRYGGILKDAQGETKQGVTFAIYKQQEGGAPVWLETQNVSVDAAGHYSVLLGSTATAGLPDDLFSSQEQRWLGVQVQGQAEQPRVLLVSVPYAMKAGEADRLAGHSASEFVTTDNLQTAVKDQLQQQTTVVAESASTTPNSTSMGAGPQAAPTNPATNFVDSTTDQVVSVRQDGTGKAIYAAAGKTSAIVGISGADAGLYGISTATTGQTAGVKASSSSPRGYGLVAFETATTGTGFSYGIYGTAASTLGVGIRGTATAASGTTVGIWGGSASTTGYGIKATADATSGNTVGLQAAVNSPTGTAALIQNLASGSITGMLLQATTKTGTQFSVDGSGNVSALGGISGHGNVSGKQFVSTVTTGMAPLQVASTTQVPNLNASLLGGNAASAFAPANGSSSYIHNGESLQLGTNFNISGDGTAGGTLTAATVSVRHGYQIGETSILSIGSASDDNLFLGLFAGANDFAGTGNTFSGYMAGYNNTTGGQNAFFGISAGYSNTTGAWNTFYGGRAGLQNTGGADNTFVGADAGGGTTTGEGNTFAGYGVGYYNTTGSRNTYVGMGAGAENLTGRYNTFYGFYAGSRSQTGSSNVYIASYGCPYPCSESNTIRIGTQGTGDGEQNVTYIGGIYGATAASGIPVYINSDGLLGTLTSSLRFKEQVRDMGGSSSALMKLRPVTFLYKPEYDKGPRTLQYGLIAEEVAEVYPDLVAYEPDGKPYTVKYQYLTTMLLNEVQKQHRKMETQAQTIEELRAENQKSQQRNEQLEQRVSRLESLIGRQAETAENLSPQRTGR